MCPPNETLPDPVPAHSNVLADILERFEDAWQQAPPPPDLDAFLPVQPQLRRVLMTLVRVDLLQRLKAGEAIRLEAYLHRYPELSDTPLLLLDLIAVEFTVRRQSEPNLGLAEYLGRFPDLGGQLRERLAAVPGVPNTRCLVPDVPSTRCGDADTTASTASAPSAGSRYRLLRLHAQGGLGEVLVAEVANLHRQVAPKRIRPKYAQTPANQQRFLREAEVTARLEHPGIVPVYGLGVRPGVGCPGRLGDSNPRPRAA
jgi:hypothetical protein